MRAVDRHPGVQDIRILDLPAMFHHLHEMPDLPRPSLSWKQHARSWQAEADSSPALSRTRIGLRLLQCGAGCMLASLPLPPIVAHFCLAAMALGAVLSLPPLHRLPGFALAVAFCLWQGLSMLNARMYGLPTDGLPSTAYTWTAFYLCAFGLQHPAIRLWAWRAVLASLAVCAVLCLLQFTIGYNVDVRPWRIDGSAAGQRLQRATGFMNYHQAQGLVMTLLLIVSWRLHRPAVVDRIGVRGGQFLAILMIILTASRTAFVAAVAGVTALSATSYRRVLMTALVSLIAIGILAGSLVLISPDKARDTYAANDGRWPIWRTDVALMLEHPLFGCGGRPAFTLAYCDAFPRACPGQTSEFPNGAPDPHDLFLGIPALYGIPALICLLGMLGAILGSAWRCRSADTAAWSVVAAVVAAYLTTGVFSTLRDSPSTYAFFALAAFAFHLDDRPGGVGAPSADGSPS